MKKKVEKFEDLLCWQEARILVRTIFRFSETGKLSKDWGTKDQIRRASLSIMNNIAEGFARFSNKEKIRFLDIASSSCSEVRSMLYVLNDLEYLSKADLNLLYIQAEKNSKTHSRFIKEHKS